MDITDLLKIGAAAIQNNSDDSTTNLSSDLIAKALASILGGGQNGNGLDLSSIVKMFLEKGDNNVLADVVSSWVGSGENKSIDPGLIGDILGSDKIGEFASMLGIGEESAKGAIADALPQMVDQATNEDASLAETMFEQLGGASGMMDILGKMLK